MPKNEAADLYYSGLSLKKIGERYGVDAVTVLNRFKEWGVTRRKSGSGTRGVPKSETHRRKIGLASRGRLLSESARRKLSRSCIGRAPWNKGLRKENHPESLRGFVGPNHWNWKGGVSAPLKRLRATSRYKVWRESVFRRDNFTCQFCDQRGGYLEADHIESFTEVPEKRFDISNGRTLCRPCHKERTKEQRHGK